MKIKIILPVFFLALALLASSLSIKAAQPTPSPSEPSITPTEENDTGVSEKIKEIRDAVKEKVKEKVEEARLGLKRAYVGEITQINDSTLTLATPTGAKEVKVSEEATLIGRSGKKIAFTDIKVGDFCIAIGYVDENNILDGRRIVIITKPKPLNREVAFGVVTDTSEEEKVLTVRNEKKNVVYTIEVTDKTIITKKVDGSTKKVKFADISKGDRLVVVGTPSENEEKYITAKIIHIIPGLSKKPTTTITLTPTPKPTISPFPNE